VEFLQKKKVRGQISPATLYMCESSDYLVVKATQWTTFVLLGNNSARLSVVAVKVGSEVNRRSHDVSLQQDVTIVFNHHFALIEECESARCQDERRVGRNRGAVSASADRHHVRLDDRQAENGPDHTALEHIHARLIVVLNRTGLEKITNLLGVHDDRAASEQLATVVAERQHRLDDGILSRLPLPTIEMSSLLGVLFAATTSLTVDVLSRPTSDLA
jgi:hypothetical protein